MIRGLAVAAVLAVALPALSAEAPLKIREFPIATIERMGQAIYRQDSAAWVATDALIARVPDLSAAHAIGWLVEDAGANQRVRFLRDVGRGPEVGWDIEVTPDLKTSVTEPSERSLSEAERSMWRARQAVLAAMAGVAVCRPGYNTVVLADPEQPGWLVWMLAPMPDANNVAMGIHYRFSVSEDGSRVVSRDALSRSCGLLDRRGAGSDGKPVAALVMTHLVSPEPVETEVFGQLQLGLPLYLVAKQGNWVIEDGHVRKVDPRAK